MRDRREHLERTTRGEEERFLATIEGGMARTTGAPSRVSTSPYSSFSHAHMGASGVVGVGVGGGSIWYTAPGP